MIPVGFFAVHVARRKGRGPAAVTTTGQAAMRRSIGRSNWPISWRRRRIRGPYAAAIRMAVAKVTVPGRPVPMASLGRGVIRREFPQV